MPHAAALNRPNSPLKTKLLSSKMAQQRLALWNAEDDLEEDVDLLTIGNYGQNIQYEDGELIFFLFFFIVMVDETISAHIHQPQIDESTLIAMQHHMAQQAAFSQIPDDVKGVRLTYSCVSVR